MENEKKVVNSCLFTLLFYAGLFWFLGTFLGDVFEGNAKPWQFILFIVCLVGYVFIAAFSKAFEAGFSFSLFGGFKNKEHADDPQDAP